MRRRRAGTGWAALVAPGGPSAAVDCDQLALSVAERDWLKVRTDQVGGLTEALVRLVRLNILTDAWIACCDEFTAVCQAAGSKSRTSVMRRVRAAANRRAVTPLMVRVLCAMTWTRPAPHVNAGPYDDPALPLPQALTRRLIVEGRAACQPANGARRAPASDPRLLRLRGLSRVEAGWLARKATSLGSLGLALCALVRNGRDHERIGHELRDALTAQPQARRDSRAQH